MKFDPHSMMARLLGVLAVATLVACGGSSGTQDPVAAATLSCDDSIRTTPCCGWTSRPGASTSRS